MGLIALGIIPIVEDFNVIAGIMVAPHNIERVVALVTGKRLVGPVILFIVRPAQTRAQSEVGQLDVAVVVD